MAVFTGKKAVIAAVLSATARITPGRLRGQDQDHMVDVIAAVKQAKQSIN